MDLIVSLSPPFLAFMCKRSERALSSLAFFIAMLTCCVHHNDSAEMEENDALLNFSGGINQTDAKWLSLAQQ
jgi:hypothetical protein